MIRHLTGIPRSGKTYFAVNEILEKLKSEDRFLILTNIEGLHADDARLIVQEFDANFFRNTSIAPFLRNLRDNNGLSETDPIYIYVDECQRYFNKPDPDVVYFFDYHGHYGVDVTLITQHEKKISPQISCHHEEEIRAAASSTNPFKSFVYKKLQAGEQFGTIRLSRKPEVFAAYKSFQAGTGKQTKSRFPLYVLGLVAAAFVLWYLFFGAFARSFGIDGDSEVRAARQPPIQKTPPPAPITTPDPLPSSPGENSTQEDFYAGPEILEFSPGRDAVLVKVGLSDLPAWVAVRDFMAQYPPMIYGFGYFHAPHKRFVMLNQNNGQIIFPTKTPLFVRETYVRDASPAPQLQAQIPYGGQFAGPGRTDLDGFTEMDRKAMKWAELTKKGFDVQFPQNNETPLPVLETLEQNQAVTP